MKKFVIAKLKGAFKKSADRSTRSTRKHISNPRRGVSIVELAVALAIISIVSGSALSIMLASSKNESKMMREIEVTNQAENAIECFRYVIDAHYGDPVGGLKDLLNKTTKGIYQIETTDNVEVVEEGENSTIKIGTVKLDGSLPYVITIEVDFENNKLEFVAVEKNDESKKIYKFSYTYTKG